MKKEKIYFLMIKISKSYLSLSLAFDYKLKFIINKNNIIYDGRR